jgi:hypothetical protein
MENALLHPSLNATRILSFADWMDDWMISGLGSPDLGISHDLFRLVIVSVHSPLPEGTDLSSHYPLFIVVDDTNDGCVLGNHGN